MDQDILIATVGTAPAVLTETLWALAHEEPPCIPHAVVALTTRPGAERIQQQLFESGVWDRFRAALEGEGLPTSGRLRFGMAHDLVRLLPDPSGRANLDDIASPEDSMAAADFILRTLREFTENPQTRLILSLAGGRKTMSALMMSCAGLLGRKQDRVCHVLVNPPYDQPGLVPAFFFPEPGVVHRFEGADHPSAAARIFLTDIPYVRVRDWYADVFGQFPPGYAALVRGVQDAIHPEALPDAVMDLPGSKFSIGAQPLALSAAEAAVLAVLLRRRAADRPLPSAWIELSPELEALKTIAPVPANCHWLHDWQAADAPVDKEAIRKNASSLRLKLASAPGGSALASLLVPSMRRRSASPPFPDGKLTFLDLPDVGGRRESGISESTA